MKTFDKRDGGPDEALQFKTWSETMRLPWNGFLERSLSGFRGTHEAALRGLIRRCRKDGETVLAACIHNYAVSVIVAPK